MDIVELLTLVREDLLSSGKQKKNLKIRTILSKLGYTRRSPLLIDKFNSALYQTGLVTEPIFDPYLGLDDRISFSLKLSNGSRVSTISEENSLSEEDTHAINNRKNQDITEGHKLESSEIDTISISHDIFYYLFDWHSKEEYERFQACLDSNNPIAIFLLPLEEDFFSDIIEKILVYELIRKKQYAGKHIELSSTRLDIQRESDSEAGTQTIYGDITHFDLSTMTNVILGSTGTELIDSEKFDQQFSQLALYANKYYSQPSFILFHCPSLADIDQYQKLDILDYLITKFTKQLPFVFTLRCKYPNDEAVQNREEIYSHLKLLMEVPNHELDDDLTLSQGLIELQLCQMQAESQLLIKMNPEHFYKLIWGNESEEHIYLKYFAIRALEKAGYDIAEINCEVTIKNGGQENDDKDISNEEDLNDKDTSTIRRPDVYVENRVIVEVETLRHKTYGGNVYLQIINSLIIKSLGWSEKLEALWLVFPGFEIARNYYQLKKTKEIIEDLLIEKYGDSCQVVILAPDYENHDLVPISFSKIEYPSFGFSNTQKIATVANRNKLIIQNDFNYVKGLHEEKNKLKKILDLQQKGIKSGIKGILFFGLPGCGKTLLAKAFAHESGRYFFNFSPADIQSVWIGQSQKNIKDIFSQAKKKAPSLLFIDEIDSIGFSRDEVNAHTDQKATINQLLIEFGNIGSNDVIVIAATNYLSGVDLALRRSGRLDWKIPIFPPDKYERTELFRHYLMETEGNLDLIDYNILGEESVRFTSSDIQLVCKQIGISILLEEINPELTTSVILDDLNNIKNGGLTLSNESVEKFFNECQSLSINSLKIEALKNEWKL